MEDGPCTAAGAESLREAVRAKYREVAARPEGCFPYATGREGALALHYEAAWLGGVAPEIVERFVGVGNPFLVHVPHPGERVLDVGCGAGLDVFVASRLVGRAGRAAGVDLCEEMLAWPRHAAASWPGANVEFRRGDAEALPFPDASFDAAISNGALNLVPDKDAAFREIRRVLAPGGTFAAADLLVIETVPAEVLASMDAWST